MREQKHINLLKNPGQFTRQFYLTLLNLYVEEFGLSWVMKELNEAKDCIAFTPGRNTVQKVLYLFEKAENANTELFIGTRKVRPDEWQIYAKGLYWMAGYDMMKNEN